MTARLIIVVTALLLGLANFTLIWDSHTEPPRTLWMSSPLSGLPEMTDTAAMIVSEYLVVQESVCNQAYVAHLKEKRQHLLANWSPLLTLEQIVSSHNPGLSTYSTRMIADAILSESDEQGLDPYLVAALIAQESRFRPGCVSPGGAVGLGQLLPSTARSLGVNPYDATQNVTGCTRYLATQMRRWQHTSNPTALALASYNAGPGAVERYGGVPPYRITQNYVVKISARRDRFFQLAQESRQRWIAANGPVMKDLYGRSLLSAKPGNPAL